MCEHEDTLVVFQGDVYERTVKLVACENCHRVQLTTTTYFA